MHELFEYVLQVDQIPFQSSLSEGVLLFSFSPVLQIGTYMSYFMKASFTVTEHPAKQHIEVRSVLLSALPENSTRYEISLGAKSGTGSPLFHLD